MIEGDSMDFIEHAQILIQALTGLNVTVWDGCGSALAEFEEHFCFSPEIQRLGDRYAEYTVKSKVPVNRKKYIRLALTCGWLCGAHRFYAKKPVIGTLYLIFFWTGVSFAMTLIDLMIALPMVPDENGNIII